MSSAMVREVEIPVGEIRLPGILTEPRERAGIVVFAHGSGSSRHSPRNRFVAERIHNTGLGTLLFDLLTPTEDLSVENRFDIPLLASRLIDVVKWVGPKRDGLPAHPIGLFGASTGGAAALSAAAQLGWIVRAVVSRGGRPDLALSAAPNVKADTLLIVGELDTEVLELNRIAYEQLRCPKELTLIRGATHLFEEPGALEAVADIAAEWFDRRLIDSADEA